MELYDWLVCRSSSVGLLANRLLGLYKLSVGGCLKIICGLSVGVIYK